MNIQSTSIIFIDPSVNSYEKLLDAVVSRTQAVILDQNRDGIEQITQVLSQHREVESVHIISHGSPGCLYLGNTQLSLSTLQRYTQELQTWFSQSVLLYGCNIAAGDAGEEFIEKLHKLTKASIAASANLTGNAALGGDWKLEVSRGEITTAQVFNPELLEGYNFVLASSNDYFANRIVLSGNSGTSSSNNVGATSESGEPTQSGTTNSVWWSWTAPASGNVVFDTVGSNFDTYLYVYTGNSVNSLTLVASNDDMVSGNTASKVNFAVTAGTTYHIAVDGYSTNTGNITLNYSFTSGSTTSNTAPTLVDTVVTLNSINEDPGTPSGDVGSLVSSLVSLGANVSDPNSGVTGIAITAANATYGTWWYSLNNGANWYQLGVVSNTSARLLAADANTRIYFQPNSNFNGTISNAITFRAWDQTSGTNGSLASTSTNGGSTAFSMTTDTASITVNPINDAPVVTSINPLRIPENASNGTIIGTLTATDVDGTTFSNWAIASGNIDLDGDGNRAFSINPNTGQLAINDIDDLNPQYNASINLQVNVSDGMTTSANQNVTIKLIPTPGDLDLKFGNGGIVTTSSNSYARSVTIQPDGKIVVFGGFGQFDLARYNVDGSLDATFGNAGIVKTSIGNGTEDGYSVVLQPDGKIVVAGYIWDNTQTNQPDFALARYNADGSLDSSFGIGGKVIGNFGEDFGHKVLVQPDGKIILAGYIGNGNADYVLVRYNTNGSLDTSFGNGGKVNGTNGYAIAIGFDGKILVGGKVGSGSDSDFALTRYNANGSLDTNFGNSGRVFAAIGTSGEEIHSIAIGADGKIVVAGRVWKYVNGSSYNQDDLAIARFNIDGTLDANFGNGGKVITPLSSSTSDRANSLSIQPNGKIVVAGYIDSGTSSSNRTTVLLAYNPDGTLDNSFGTGGQVITPIKSHYDETDVVATQSDGKLVVVGSVDYSYFAVARFLGVSNFVPPAVANTAPTLADTIVTLTGINENAGAPTGAVGTLVSSIVSTNTNVTDPNSGGLTGIAITGANTANGTWWFSTNSGTSWNPLGSVSEDNARLLVADAYSRIYFQPNANFSGDISNAITFRAWDRTSGLNGITTSTINNGGTTAFSSSIDTASVTIKPTSPVYHQLAVSDFSQDWSNTSLITTDDDWTNIASIRGFRGDYLVSSYGVDPQTVLADGSLTPIDVNANQTNSSTYTNAGVTEFTYEGNPTIALRGSSTAVAPHLVLYLNATGRQNLRLNFTLKDIDTSARDAMQSVALQYRIGNTGNFINLPAAFVFDASNNATTSAAYDAREARLSVLLPSEVTNQAQVQIRFITTDTYGEDEWIGIDDIKVTSTAISTNQAPVTKNDSYLVSENSSLTTGAAITSLILDSDRGNYIGQSDYYSYTPLTGSFTASRAYPTNPSSNNAVQVSYSGDKWWNLSFAAPFNAPLTTGVTYTGAARFPFQTTNQPGLSVSGDGRGYNSLTGEFTINQIIYGVGSEILSFDATFRENGDGDPISESFRGRIQYNATSGNLLPGVLTNDTDSEKTALKATLVSGTQNGSLVFNPDGSFSYTPNTGFKGIDSFTYRTTDGIADSNIATVTLKVGVSDAPVISSWPGYAATYTENAAAIFITESYVKVTDPDSANFDNGKLTVRIKNGGSSDDRLTIRNEGTFISQINLNGNIIKYGTLEIGTFSGGFGTEDLVINLNANVTPYAVEALLRNITYVNVSDNPSTTPRTIEVVLTDGDGGISAAVTRTINVNAINDAPVISLPGTNPTYTENAPAIFIDLDATVADLDSQDFDAGKLTVSFSACGTADDRLIIQNNTTNNIGVNNADILYNTSLIGTFSGGIGTQDLVINLTSKATQAAVQALLRSIAYTNVSDNPTTNPRSFSFVLSDGDGGTSTIINKTINVIAVNDAPVITPGQSFSMNENSSDGKVVGTIVATDVEGTTTFSDWAITDGNFDRDGDGKAAFNINPTSGQITVNDSDDLDFESNPNFQLQVTVSDRTSVSTKQTVTINLKDVNEIYGTPSTDRLTGSTADDYIYGYEGNDYLYGGAGSDTLIGGGANDYLYGEAGNDILNGGAGNDYLYGSAGDDTFDGGDGIDYLTETADVDFTLTNTQLMGLGTDSFSNIEWVKLTGGNSNNTLDASAFTIGSAYLYGQGGNDTLKGGAANDYLYGGIGDDALNGGAGNDYVYGEAGNDILNGGDGNDSLNGGVGDDVMLGGLGNDTYFVDSTSDSIFEEANAGTDTVNSSISLILGDNFENLTLTGTSTIHGTGNILNNTLSGNSGANNLFGNEGNDRLSGNNGDDFLDGGTGDDTLLGGLGNDNLNGGVGNDSLDGGVGDDVMLGGLGNDTYFVDSTSDSIFEEANAGTDTVNSSISLTLGDNFENLTLTGTNAIHGTGNILNNTLSGNSGANNLFGNEGNDRLSGNSGDDLLDGGTGDDTLLGGLGNDVLIGGIGNDVLTGNTGVDIFVFNNPNQGVDKITDFSSVDDILHVSAASFGGGLTAGAAITVDQILIGSGAVAATSASQLFIYNTSTGALFFDADGNQAGFGAVQIASLSNRSMIANHDIFVTA